VILRESRAVAHLAENLGDSFGVAGEMILGAKARIACVGVGKAGIIARKFAATLASLGTPASFVHATEALHGDLGMITGDDLVIVICHSGTTPRSSRSWALSPSLRFPSSRSLITPTPRSPAAQTAFCARK